jgi:hypothetical protein
MTTMKRPDVTPAQIVGLIGSALALIVAFGVDLSADQQAAVIDFAGKAVAALFGSDALIRFGRSRIAAAAAARGEAS